MDEEAVARVEEHIRQVASDPIVLQRALQDLSDAEVIHLAYIARLPVPSGLTGAALQDYIMLNIQQRGFALHLAGELLRRHPRLIEFS